MESPRSGAPRKRPASHGTCALRAAVTDTGWSNRNRHFHQLPRLMNRSLTLFPLLPLLSYFSFIMFTSSVLDVCTLVPVCVCGTFFNNLDDVTLLSFVLYSITVQVLRVCILAKIYIFIRNVVVSGPLDNVPTLAMGNF